MIREQQIDAVFAVIKSYTTFPRKFIVGPGQGSSFCRNRTYAAVLLREVIGLGVKQIAEILERDSHSTVVDMIKNSRSEKRMAAELELLAARLRERLGPEDFDPNDAAT